jgi:hypothetical protein
MKFIISLLFVSLGLASSAQIDTASVEIPVGRTALDFAEDSLKVLSDSIRISKDLDTRLQSSESLLDGLIKALEEPGSFAHAFDSVRLISKIYPADSTFRIMTWQLYVDVNDYKYFGIIQTADENPRVHVLEDYSARMRRPDFSTLSADNWYGALYYNIKDFKTKEGKMYLLFGFDAYSFFERRKLLDVLSFDKDGDPVFGSPVIEHTKRQRNVPPTTTTYHRFILQYSAEAAIGLNFNEEHDMVMFDHLLTMGSPSPDVPYVQVPDGSYEGLKLKRGKWVHVEKIFSHTYDEPPRPAPIFDNRKGRGLFGGNE